MYQIIPNGELRVVVGNLGSDLQVVETSNGSRYAQVGVAISAGRIKDSDGNWTNRTEWVNVAIFDNGGASAQFLDVITNPPSEGLAFKKGNRVQLVFYGFASLEVNNGKTYLRHNVTQFLHCGKVLGASKSDSVGDEQLGTTTTTTTKEKTKSPGFKVSEESKNFDFDKDVSF